MNELENQNLLVDSILGNKIIYRGETKFGTFIDKMNSEIRNYLSIYSRQYNTKLYCLKWVFLCYIKEDIESLLRPDNVTLYKE